MKKILLTTLFFVTALISYAQTCTLNGGTTKANSVVLTEAYVSSNCPGGFDTLVLNGTFRVQAGTNEDLSSFGALTVVISEDSELYFPGNPNQRGTIRFAVGTLFVLENCDDRDTSGHADGYFTFDSSGGPNVNVLYIGDAGFTGPKIMEYDALCEGVIVPIELVSFEAEANGNDTDLSWTTASEINNDFFTIEYSTDGVNFMSAGEVDGAGTSEISIDYSYTHANAFDGANSTVFYRLKQTDFDGKYTYSKIVAVNFEGGFENKVFPNPVVSGANAVITSSREIHSITIFNVNGQVVREIETGGSNVENIGTADLAKGIYFIRLNGAQNAYKLVVN